MSITIKSIINIFETIAPQHFAESWDNVGLMLGSPEARVSSILIGLDPTLDLMSEAQSCGADLIITHHPIIFHPLSNLDLAKPDTQFIVQAIKMGINIFACHTNFDSTPGGVSDILAHRLGLANLLPLSPLTGREDKQNSGLGRIGDFQHPIPVALFLSKLNEACRPSWLLGAGPIPQDIARVAVCGGACCDLAANALAQGADVFVTAEVKHSIARWAEQAGLWIIDAGHFATEQLAMEKLVSILKKKINAAGLDIPIRSAIQSSPLQLL